MTYNHDTQKMVMNRDQLPTTPPSQKKHALIIAAGVVFMLIIGSMATPATPPTYVHPEVRGVSDIITSAPEPTITQAIPTIEATQVPTVAPTLPIPTSTNIPPTVAPIVQEDDHAGMVWVRPYTRKDGTHVDGYWRRKPSR